MQDKKHNKKLQAKPLLSGVEDIRQDFEDALEGGTYTYGIEILDDAVNTIRKGSTTFIIARPNTGKAITLDTKILTPNGWVLNKDIKLGDFIIGLNGKPTKVIGVFPQGVTDTYKVTFADGREIITSPEHLWKVESSRFSKPRTLTTAEIMRLNKKDYLKNRLRVPQYSGNHGTQKDFKIPPYVMGVLLGDGCLTMGGLVYCKPDLKVLEKIKSFLPDRDIVMHGNKNVSIRKSPDLIAEIKRYKLKVKSYEKFIPADYLEGTSKEQRLQLLEGLLDTDGHQSKSYNEFSTTSEQLAKDVQQLSWSLGFDCRIRTRIGKYKKEGRTICTRTNYRVTISNQRTKGSCIIKDITPYKKQATQCIAVDAPDRLFVIENYIVTHNSLFGLRIATNLAKQGLRVLICSCEMGAGLLIEREIKRLCGISNWELQRLYTESRDYANKILDSLIEDEEYSFLSRVEVTETAGATVYDMIELFELEKYDCIVIDYIQRISGTGTEYEIISNSARELQNYARRSKVPLIICSQAKRGNDSNKDDIDGYEIRGKGSGSIEEDADVGITLMELFENNEKFILASLFKNRYSHIKRLAYKYKLDSRLNLTLIKKNME